MDEFPANHVRILQSQKDLHWYIEMDDTENPSGAKIIMDVGTDYENARKIIQIIEKDYGGVHCPPNSKN